MKNVHLLPTDKPSRLSILNSGKLNFGAEIMSSSNSKPQHIYITSDEEIKDAKWIIHNGKIHEVTKNKGLYITVKELSHIDIRADLCKKIILTTDQDLIKDGVQAIDDEFLEWFVKNPSCEEVEIKRNFADEGIKGITYYGKYFLIIPKEEPKQETVGKQFYEAADKVITVKRQEEPKQENCCTPIGQIKRYKDCIGCDRKPKQETLEEAKDLTYWRKNAEEDYIKVPISVLRYITELEERMYSEEEVVTILDSYNKYLKGVTKEQSVEEWFEQFKKK